MRLRTIWTLPAMPLRERLSRTRERSWQLAARHLPRRLAYWSFIDTGAKIMRDDVGPEVTYMTLLDRMENR